MVHVATPPDFILRLEWQLATADGEIVFTENSGVFIRFPHPNSKSFHNPAYVPVEYGFEVQIDPQGLAEDGRTDVAEFRTGGIYSLDGPSERPNAPPGRWNDMEIDVRGRDTACRSTGFRRRTTLTQLTMDGAGRARRTTLATSGCKCTEGPRWHSGTSG